MRWIVITMLLCAAGFAQTKAASPARKSTASKAKASSKSKGKAAPKRWVQTQPTPDRYKEIQQALADKGYFKGNTDGVWGADSVEAFKRFQKDQNLETDGKLGALALMALGLGPRREPLVPPPAQPAGDAANQDLAK